MKTITKLFGYSAALALALIVLSSVTCAADDTVPQSPDQLMKAMAEAGKPGSEHAKLEPLAGNWTYTGKFWMDPSKPPMDCSGTIERKWALGGRFLKEKLQGTGLDGKSDFEGMGLLGYDNGQKQFVSNFACNMGTGICTGVGAYDTSSKAFTFETESYCSMQKKIVKGRDVVRIESNDKVVLESYVMDGGKELKIMEIVSVRKK